MGFREFDGSLDGEEKSRGYVEFNGKLDEEPGFLSKAKTAVTSLLSGDGEPAETMPGAADMINSTWVESNAEVADMERAIPAEAERLRRIQPNASDADIQALAKKRVIEAMDAKPAKRGNDREERVQRYIGESQDRAMPREDAEKNVDFDLRQQGILNSKFTEPSYDPAQDGEKIATGYDPTIEREQTRQENDQRAAEADARNIHEYAKSIPAPIRGLGIGMGQSYALMGGAVGYLGDLIDNPEMQKAGVDWYNENMRSSGAMRNAPSFTGIASAADASEWVAENLGYVAYQAAEAFVSFGIGGQVGKKVGKEALVGAIAGFINNERQTIGAIYGDAVENAKATGEPIPSLLQIAVGATTSAAVDTFADKLGIDAAMVKSAKGGIFTRLAKTIPAQMGVQGGTEGVQLVPEEWGAGKDPFRPGMAAQYIDEMAVGALGGAGPGIMQGIRQPDAPSTQPPPFIPPAEVISAPSIDAAIAAADAATQPVEMAQPPAAVAPVAPSFTPAPSQSFPDIADTPAAPAAIDSSELLTDIQDAPDGQSDAIPDAVVPADSLAQWGDQLPGSVPLAPVGSDALGGGDVQPAGDIAGSGGSDLAAGTADAGTDQALDAYLAQRDGKWKLKAPPPVQLRDAVIAEMDRRNNPGNIGESPVAQLAPAATDVPSEQQASEPQALNIDKFDPQGLLPGTPEYEAAFAKWAEAKQESKRNEALEQRRSENQSAVDKKNGWRKRLVSWFESANDGDTITTDIEGEEFRVVEKTIKRNGKDVVSKALVEVGGNGDGANKTIVEYRDGKRYQGPNTEQGVDEFAGWAQSPETDIDARAASVGKMLDDGIAKVGSADTAQQNPEASRPNPVAESIAPEPSEPGDGGVAPTQDKAAPAIKPAKGGKLDISGFTAAEVKAVAKDAGFAVDVRSGSNGRLLVTAMAGKRGVAAPFTKAQEKAIREGLTGKDVKTPKQKTYDTGTLLGAIRAIGGIALSEMQDITGETNRRGDLFREGGQSIDEIARALANDYGFGIDLNSPNDNGGVNQAAELIREALDGTEVLSMERQEQAAHKADVMSRAEVLGVKTKFRKFSAIEQDVLKLEEQKQKAAEAKLDEVESAAYDEVLERAYKVLGDDRVQDALEELAGKYEALSARDYQRAAREYFEGLIHAELQQAAEGPAGASSQVGGESAGVGGTEAPGFSLETQSEADLRAREEQVTAAKAAEEAAAREAEAKARKEQAAKDKADIQNRLANQPFEFGVGAKEAKTVQPDLLSQPSESKTIAEASLGDLLRAAADKADGKEASEGKPARPYATPDDRSEAIYDLQAKAKDAGLDYSDKAIKDAAEFGAPADEIAAAIDAGEDAVSDLAERYATRSNGLRQGFGPAVVGQQYAPSNRPVSERDQRIDSLTGRGLYELPEDQRASLLKMAKVRSVDAFENMAISDRREVIGRWIDAQPVSTDKYAAKWKHWDERSAKWGMDKILEEARDAVAGNFIGREFGESAESFYAHNDAARATRDWVKAQDQKVGAGDTPAAQQQAEGNDHDHFTLERLNRDANEMESVTFARGEYVRYRTTENGEDLFGEIDGISHARREFSVDGLWYPFGFAYKSERPEAAKPKNTVPVSKVIDAINKKHGEGLTEADRVPKTGPYTLAEHADLMDRLEKGEVSLDEYKSAFGRLRASKDALTAELSAMKKDDIMSVGRLSAHYKSDTKDRLVKSAANNLADSFHLGENMSYVMGQHDKAIIDYVNDATADTLAEYAARRKARVAEYIARRTEMLEGIKNPQTISDFQSFISYHKRDGKTNEEARMMLTPEQRVRFDSLLAEESRAARKGRAEQAEVVRAPGEAVGASEIIKTRHTKHGHDLWQFTLDRRVAPDEFRSLVAQAKRMGGDYSSYRGNGAIPGWQFRTEEAAIAFRQLVAGDATAAQAVVAERRDAYADDRSQTAVERLNEMADKLEDAADDKLNADRKTNTDKRARQAASAESAANTDKALAKTMRNIAEAISNGSAKFLDRVRQKVQVEMLREFLNRAKDNEIRAKYPTYREQENHKGEKPTDETADYADYPRYTAFRSDLAKLGRQLLENDGTKKLGASLLKVADDVTDAYLDFAKKNLHKVSTFKTANGEAIYASRDDAETAIKRSGFKGKAIVLPFKRGQNIIIQSPSFAKENGIWKGDDDRRITLTPDFGAELVEAAKKFASQRFDIPWVFNNTYDSRKRLSGLGIETAAEFRTALREFSKLSEAVSAPDKIKEMERKMIGRRNDGLDFFPTPQSVADEMIEAADIKEGMSVLEPSAGMGHIAERIRAAGVDPDVIELSGDRRELLEAKGFAVVGNDFMEMTPRGFTYGDVFRAPDGALGVMRGSGGLGSGRVGLDLLDENGQPDTRRGGWYDREDLVGVEKRASNSGYDRIIMNPPFGDRRDAEHVQHAYTLLKPGGRLVAIMGEGVFFGQDKKAQAFREWLDEVGGTSEKLEDGTFLDPSLPVNTGVNARMVVIDKETDKGVAFYDMGGIDQEAGGKLKSVDTSSPEFKRWFGDSKVVDAEGKPLVVYHGTAYDFDSFDAGRNRTELNDKYQGDGFHFSPDPQVASRYADANRNQLLRKQDIYPLVEQRFPGRIAQLFREVVEQGYEKAWDVSDEEVSAILQAGRDANVDLNDLLDLAEVVEGSKYHAGRENANDPSAIFSALFGGSGGGLLSEYHIDDMVKMGLDAAAPKQNVMPVYLKIENLLRTDSREQAKSARANGYDGVYYYGPDLVGGEPEWIVFEPTQIKSATSNTGEFSKTSPNILRDFTAIEQLPQRTDAIIANAHSRAIDRAIAIEQGKDVRPAMRTVITAELKGAINRLYAGKISEGMFVSKVEGLYTRLVEKREAKKMEIHQRARGDFWLRQKLLGAVRDGVISEREMEMAEWLIKQNPALVDDLGISIKLPKDGQKSSGNYDQLRRVFTLFANQTKHTTAAHEILHHTERLMPLDVQQAIREEWLKGATRLLKRDDLTPEYRDYLEKSIASQLDGNAKSAADAMKIYAQGKTGDNNSYQWLNPSEYWAVNAAKLVAKRFDAQGSIWKKAYQWLSEFIEKAKGVFGMQSNASVIRALDQLINENQGGKAQADSQMLGIGQMESTSPSAKRSALVNVFLKLAGMEESAKYPKSNKTDMKGLAADLSTQLEVGEPEVTKLRYIDDDGSVAYRESSRRWNVKASDGSPVYVTENIPEGTIYINVSELKEGESEGSLIYQLVGQYAYNNGLKFIGDPYGITNGAIYRRTENMISLAIKLGTTDFMEPHPDQLKAEDNSRQGKEFFWPGFEWNEGDFSGNLHNMLMASYTAIEHHVPEISDVIYDAHTMQFRNTRTGQEVTDDDFDKGMAKLPGARKSHAGSTTLKRAALANSVVSGQLSESEWGNALDELASGKMGSRLEGTALDKIRYSMNINQTPAQAGVSASGVGNGRIIGDSGRQYTPEQAAMFKQTGREVDPQSTLTKLRQWVGQRWQQGIFDQFQPVREISMQGYTLMRLSKGATGAFEAFMKHGKLSLRDGAYDADTSGGVLSEVFFPIGKETTDFLYWIAGNRAERLAAEGKERLFSPADIAAAKSLADGTTDFDYTLPSGQVTRDRTLIYKDSLRKFNEFSKNVMDMAEQSGLIDGVSRHMWEHEFYVPFYRTMDDQAGGIRGMNIKQGIVRQEAFKKLKGGKEGLNDLLANTLMNWAHLIDAAAKNRAAKETLESAERMGAARKAAAGEKHTVWYMDGGKRIEYAIDDTALLTALQGLDFAGLRGPVMTMLQKPKHWLTIGVTASPYFKIRNLIRDSVQAIGTSELSYNIAGNVIEGIKLTNRERQEYVSALAGGGLIRFGTMLEGNEAARVRQLIKKGAKDEHILDSESKIRKFYDATLEPAIAAYNELGNRGEEINRMSLYDQLIKQGVDHATASLMARDLMDFSMQGSFTTIRFLAQVIPFFNARLQGMYKLGRTGTSKQLAGKLAMTTFTTALLSLSLLAAFGDDDDWKKREDWDRDNYWWFKFAGMAYRIPKPFEIGAVATLAERTAELIFDKEMTGKRFRDVVLSLVGNQLAMNPVPQAIKPIFDIYSNVDSFTKRPIESMSMQRLEPEYRYTANTTMPARYASKAMMGALSPVQIDHLVRGYFAWLGATSVAAADIAIRLVDDSPTKPALDYWKLATGGMVADLGSAGSRYVSQMYDQVKELETAYSTYRKLQKDRRFDEAKEYRESNKDKLRRYHQAESVKKQVASMNERIRMIELSNKDADEKREAINLIRKRQDKVARRLSPH